MVMAKYSAFETKNAISMQTFKQCEKSLSDNRIATVSAPSTTAQITKPTGAMAPDVTPSPVLLAFLFSHIKTQQEIHLQCF
jgi:hypothetical protein